MQGRQRVYMKNQQKFYNIENLLESKCEYNILLGERSNGKSYATKYMVLWESFNEEDYLSLLIQNARETTSIYEEPTKIL